MVVMLRRQEVQHICCVAHAETKYGLQVFSFSSNAMPDDISVMTMAGVRTRSGPPDNVKQ